MAGLSFTVFLLSFLIAVAASTAFATSTADVNVIEHAVLTLCIVATGTYITTDFFINLIHSLKPP